MRIDIIILTIGLSLITPTTSPELNSLSIFENVANSKFYIPPLQRLANGNNTDITISKARETKALSPDPKSAKLLSQFSNYNLKRLHIPYIISHPKIIKYKNENTRIIIRNSKFEDIKKQNKLNLYKTT